MRWPVNSSFRRGQGRRDSGAGGRYPAELRVRTMVEAFRHRSLSTVDSSRVSNTPLARSASRSLPLKLSMYPFSPGDPGSRESVFNPTRSSHSRTRLAVNYEPLSLRMWSGTTLRTD